MISVCMMIFALLICFFINAVELQETNQSWLNLNINRFRRQADSSGISCTLPSHPENGRWSVLNGDAEPGDIVAVNTVLKFECNRGYKLTANQYVVCDSNWKTSQMPECEKLCPPLTSTSKTTLKCVDKRGNEISCREATEGSYLSYKCADFYETPFGHKKTLLCIDGTWNYPKPVCQPVCGKKINDNNAPLIYGGETKEVIEYPWVTALYSKTSEELLNVCGGTIISPRVVITAAHCVTNGYGDVFPKENYRIGAGKLHNKYNDSRDPDGQYLEVGKYAGDKVNLPPLKVSRIIVHPGYKGENRRFQADIAVLIAKGSFTLNAYVQPVCFNDLNNINIYAGNLGVIAGWGVQDDGLPAEKLKTLEIPYKYETTCTQELPREWADKYAMIDKICAGFYNRSMSVCKGDSGGGLVFKNPEDNRYYIHGVVSIGPSEKGECNIQQNSLYTKVAFYYEFLDKEISKYFVDECTLPQHPKNGKWTIEGSEKKPGDTIAAGTLLKYKCNKGFKLSGSSEIACDSTSSKPTCLATCPALSLPTGAVTSCKNKKGDRINCGEAVEGATLSYTCPKGYVVPQGTKTTRTCTSGSWGSTSPKCEHRVETTTPPTKVIENGKQPKVICGYASWQTYRGVEPEHLNVSLCTHLVYAFIGLWPSGKVRVQDEPLDVGEARKGLYYRVTDLKKVNKNLKVLLSVGGSGASNASLFSSMAADSQKRSTFITSAIKVLRTYNFDGLELEWLFPTVQDSRNYMTLIREMKQELKKLGLLFSVSVRSDPADTGYEAVEMNMLLDWVTVRSYDMYGPWSKYTGQNSALFASSAEYHWEKDHLNIDAVARNWVAAGITKSKLVIGIAFYGRSFILKDSSQNGVHAPITGAGPGETEGFLRYSEICDKYKDWPRIWDNEQKNPYKYFNNVWFGYDDKDSVRIKAAYVRDNEYAGVNVWPVDGDDVHGRCGQKQQLLRQIRMGLGYAVK